MAGESKIARLASSTTTVSDVKFAPIKTASQKSIVTREEMDDFTRQANERIQEIQNAFNALALAVKLGK